MIAIGSDHGGFDLKQRIVAYLQEKGIPYKDMGCPDKTSCDYPVYAKAVAREVAGGICEKGILVCTTGIGISIVANRIKGIRCALCTNIYMAKMTRLHNDANILALGGEIVGGSLALEIVETFLGTEFSGEEKHVRRIGQMESL